MNIIFFFEKVCRYYFDSLSSHAFTHRVLGEGMIGAAVSSCCCIYVVEMNAGRSVSVAFAHHMRVEIAYLAEAHRTQLTLIGLLARVHARMHD